MCIRLVVKIFINIPEFVGVRISVLELYFNGIRVCSIPHFFVSQFIMSNLRLIYDRNFVIKIKSKRFCK